MTNALIIPRRNVTVVTDCKKRWITCYLMLCRLIELRDPITDLCSLEPLLFDHELTTEQWQQANNLVTFFDPFYKATLELSKCNVYNYSLVYPQYKAITKHFKDTISLSSNDHHPFASPVLFKLKDYKAKVINDDSLMATFLDPYLKCNLKNSHKQRLMTKRDGE